MIYDCFLYSSEKECLEVRINELKGLDVTHVIVQSNRTFTGNPKPVYEIDYPNCINIIVEDMPDDCDAWTREAWQRNAIMRGLTGAKDDDIVIIADADEIPSKTSVEGYDFKTMGIGCFLMDMYYYWFNCLVNRQYWKPTKILTFAELKKSTPNKVRNGGYQTEIKQGGHHFSWLGDGEYALNKIKSFSHQEFNIPGLTAETFQYKIDNGEDFCTQNRFEIVDIDESYPKYLRDNQEKFKALIKSK